MGGMGGFGLLTCLAGLAVTAIVIAGVVALILWAARSGGLAAISRPASPVPTPLPVSTPASPSASPETSVCPNCGQPMQTGWSHCAHCGAPLG